MSSNQDTVKPTMQISLFDMAPHIIAASSTRTNRASTSAPFLLGQGQPEQQRALHGNDRANLQALIQEALDILDDEDIFDDL